MAIVTQFNSETETFTIKISEHFNFSVTTPFRNAMQQISTNMKTVVVDLQNVDYLDSSGLGMLLLLNDRVRANKQNFYLFGAKGEVKTSLDIAKFGLLITIK